MDTHCLRAEGLVVDPDNQFLNEEEPWKGNDAIGFPAEYEHSGHRYREFQPTYENLRFWASSVNLNIKI